MKKFQKIVGFYSDLSSEERFRIDLGFRFGVPVFRTKQAVHSHSG
jgi:hypothetical protein